MLDRAETRSVIRYTSLWCTYLHLPAAICQLGAPLGHHHFATPHRAHRKLIFRLIAGLTYPRPRSSRTQTCSHRSDSNSLLAIFITGARQRVSHHGLTGVRAPQRPRRGDRSDKRRL